MRRVLKILRARHRLTIVDAGSGDDKRTWAMLGLADVVLVPIVPEMPAIKIFRELLRQAPSRGLFATRLIPIMMRATSVLPGHIQSIESMLRMSLPWRVRSDGRRAMDSITAGTPFVLSSPESPLSQEVRALAACLPAEDGLTRLHTAARAGSLSDDHQLDPVPLAHKTAS
jgi:MinD-like ATPase involved in chromosome partitioning or flagellar assembly